MPVTGPEAEGVWTARRIVGDRDLTASMRCGCGSREFDMWRIHSRQRDDDLEHMPFRCRHCGERAEALEVRRWVVGHFELAVTITYVSYDDKHRPQMARSRAGS